MLFLEVARTLTNCIGRWAPAQKSITISRVCILSSTSSSFVIPTSSLNLPWKTVSTLILARPVSPFYHPMLPYRCQNKLTFPLCAACEEALVDTLLMQKIEQVCDQAPADRAPTDMWCTPELEMALRKGYKLIFIHQVYHFKDQLCGLFKDYLDTWLKLKEEASCYPSDCVTGAQQREHAQQ